MTKEFLPKARKLLSARRLVLLGSVAAIGAAVILAGPSSYRPLTLGTPAHAVEAGQPQAGFADLIDKVKPAVISVRVKIEQEDKSADNSSGMQSFGDSDQMQQFFKQFGMPNFRMMKPQARQVITGLGSGFFISADGYAVTNFHVVDHAKTVEIKTDAGKTYTAKVVGSDEKTDLALIKVDDAGTKFPFEILL